MEWKQTDGRTYAIPIALTSRGNPEIEAKVSAVHLYMYLTAVLKVV